MRVRSRKQPAQRYQSAQEVVEVLGEHLLRLQQPSPQSYAPTTAVPPMAKSPSRGPRVAVVLAVAAVLLVAGIIFIQTPKGELVIETDDPDIAFRVTPDGVKLEDRKTQREYDLKIAAQNPQTGEYQLEVTDKLADMGFTTKTFTIRRGERVALKVQPRPSNPLEPVKPAELAKVEPAKVEVAPPPREASGWTSLFNGKDLTGWKVIAADPAASWTIKDGVLRGSGPTSFLATERDTFANFHVRAELRINAGGDSGLYFRTAFPGANQQPPNIRARGYEAQVLGLTGVGSGTGAIFWEAPIAANIAPQPQPDTWFVLELIAEENRLRTLVNGQLAAEVVDAERRAERGQLALQIYEANTVIECRKIEIQELPSRSENPPPLAIAPFDQRQAQEHQAGWAKRLGQPVEITNSLGMKLRLIPPGEFLMGSPDSDSSARDMEKPQHAVRLTKPFYAGIHEVTVAQFRAFVEATGYETDAEKNGVGSWFLIDLPGKGRNPDWTWRTPGFEQTDEHPVCCASWLDAERFCAWLSAKERQLYHLPTEAQWEYACSAGTATQYHFGDTLDLSMMQVRAKGTAPVGSFAANAFGLYDMLGNAYEWCHDGRRAYGPDLAIDPVGPVGKGVERVVRGGAWSSTPNARSMAARASSRFVTCAADRPFHGLGFRVILIPEVQAP